MRRGVHGGQAGRRHAWMGAAGCLLALWTSSCGFAPTPFVVHGPGTLGNEAPTLEILEPNANLTRSQGDSFLIRWTDSDRDDNAQISFSLVSTATNESVLVAANIDENDTIGPDELRVETTLIPQGTYNLAGTIDDGVNAPVQVFATVAGSAERVVITIVGPGEGPQTVPPTISVMEPAFNRSVTQDDTLVVVVQPTPAAPDPNVPFDPDSTVRVFIVLDVDQDPGNDDPANPDPNQIIVLRDRTIQPGDFDAITFEIGIDLAQIPPREGGEPYFIRATISDGTNPPVHSYAVGKISVVQLAAGEVDLFDIGRTKSGAKFQGFNPGALTGSTIKGGFDFDADGVDDFMIVARFGNPQNVGPVGEAYLIYGQGRVSETGQPIPGDRFGGTIPVNSVSDTISGVVFQAPPIRTSQIPVPDARTEGITDVAAIPDLNLDGRPELIFGLPHVHGAFDSMDYDPGDESSDLLFCYPDLLANNLSGGALGVNPNDLFFYAGGMAVTVNSSNRDSDPRVQNPPLVRLDTTAISLELTGQRPFILDAEGQSPAGSIIGRADVIQSDDAGSDPANEAARIAGWRVIAGPFDYIQTLFFQSFEPPREGLFAYNVGALGDQNSDGASEIIISSPHNERYLADLENTEGLFSTHLNSTVFTGSITVLPGDNYNMPIWRESGGADGTSTIPRRLLGACTGNPQARGLFIPADTFEIFAEDIDDFLHEGQSAGDFNQDGIDDILCGAPLNDRSSSLRDTGAAYVIYGRPFFGEVDLKNADDPLRVPMLRIRGINPDDRIGWSQATGLDVNGDRIDDVFIASPRVDFGGVTRDTCAVDVNRDGVINQTDLTLRSFENCMAVEGDEVFSNSACDAFDYDNDGDIDEDDRCVFCCLSDDCTPSSDCVLGTVQGACCDNLVDNGFVGVIFGGVTINGDRDISQLATSQLPGVVFYGAHALDRAGVDVSSAGDFNQDGFGDILIAVPGETRVDSAGRTRVGVVYLVFGGTHLTNTTWSLADVGTEALPGIVFLSPYVAGRPNEAAPLTVSSIGDINNDGFDDIAIGNPMADFIDLSFPQGPNAPGDDPATGRRRNVGDVYVIYGNNFGPNRLTP
ncbi:MAG: hypothetical protein D6788_07675 [Planctomycetota bacterium]|nr:MAG: hypothetical protein D6788_07675 [Planctomycetota bacterium]